jgi:2-C-methyl-D-erythritol 4-phosphate cytidylyltransferase
MAIPLRAAALIAAAGRGERFGENKLFASLLGRPLLAWTLQPFLTAPFIERVVLVLKAEDVPAGRALVEELRPARPVTICLGGARRQDSVRNGLAHVGDAEWVIVHDGARPCVTEELIVAGLEAAQATGAAIAALPVSDTIKLVTDPGVVEGTPPRSFLWAAQTPQVFQTALLREAYETIDLEVTDDATLVEKLGVQVVVYPGDEMNRKVTSPLDLLWVEAALRQRLEGRAPG